MAINKAWYLEQDTRQQGDWERMRLLATIVIQPHVKKKLTPEKLLPLPWDRKRRKAAQSDEPQLTKEQKHKRFKDLLHRLGED